MLEQTIPTVARMTSHTPPASPALDAEPAAEDRHWIRRALLLLGILAVAWALILAQVVWPGRLPLTEPVVIGVALMAIAVVTFFGFYLASPGNAPSRDPWMRNSIAAAIVMFYVVLMTFMLTNPLFRDVTWRLFWDQPTGPTNIDATGGGATFGERIFDGLTGFVTIVLAFYFGATTVEHVINTIQTGQTERKAIEANPEVAQEILARSQRGS
jgi:hypothetical protein